MAKSLCYATADNAARLPCDYSLRYVSSVKKMRLPWDSNEITAVPKLLELLNLDGAVVTLDAMHCQTETVQAIRKKRADYIVPVKGNQPTLHQEIQHLFEQAGDV